MEIVVSVVIGAAAGGLALLPYKSRQMSEWSTIAVGILGALLGMVSNFWIGFPTMLSTPITSSLGAILTLFLWIVAQKLLVSPTLPVEQD